MLVDFALFEQDSLLERGAIRATREPQCSHLEKFHIAYQLVGDAATVVLSNFAPEIDVKTATLDMPLHHSTDWESVEIGRYTFAFKCVLDG